MILSALNNYAGVDNKGAANLSWLENISKGQKIINSEIEYMYLQTARHIHATPGTENGLVQNLVAANTDPQLLNPLLYDYILEAKYRADGRNNHNFGVDEAAEDAQIRVLREIQKNIVPLASPDQIKNMQNYLVYTKEFDPLNSYDPNKHY